MGSKKEQSVDTASTQIDAVLDMIEYLSFETQKLSPVTAFILQMAKENLRDEVAKAESVK